MGNRRNAADPNGVARGGGPCRKLALFHEISYVWYFLRCMFLFPASFNETGGIHFDWRSRWTVLTVCGWLVMIPYILYCAYLVAQRESERPDHTLQEYAELITVFVLILFAVALPVSLFIAMPKFYKVTVSWRRMEAKYRALTGAAPSLNIRPYGFAAAVAVQVYGLALIAALYHQLRLSPWQAPALTYATFSMFSLPMMWIGAYVVFGTLARSLAGRLVPDVERLGPPAIRVHRLLWLHVNKLLEMFNSSWSPIQLPFLLSMFVMCTAYFFSFVYTALNVYWQTIKESGHETLTVAQTVGNFAAYTVGGGGIFLMCAATQFAVDSIRDGARRRLLRMSLQNRSRTARHEVAYFLEDIRSKRVRVALGGFMEISRTSVVTMAVTATTYIVVMSQFAMQVQS